MRSISIALIAAMVALGAGTIEAAADDCRIADSALCLADKNCHWDGEHRGCAQGPGVYADACAAHSDKTICDSDVSLGCQWSAESSKCVTKKN